MTIFVMPAVPGANHQSGCCGVVGDTTLAHYPHLMGCWVLINNIKPVIAVFHLYPDWLFDINIIIIYLFHCHQFIWPISNLTLNFILQGSSIRIGLGCTMGQHVLISLEKLFFSYQGHTLLIFATKCSVNQWWKLEIKYMNMKLNSDQFSLLNF